MKYTRIYTDESCESHFEDVNVELEPVNFAPPAPPLNLSPFISATQFAFCSFPAGWRGDWHPVPQRQIFFILSGETTVKVSDGEIRTFKVGDAILGEDTKGKGHVSWVSSETDAHTAVVQLS
ncbi:MAG: hypothetical protein JSU79_07190 [Dehalococcoidales bacterium]|nr:MAG: hypothetical protein JSU79_07190 [Dehalococcoidales bacterium]